MRDELTERVKLAIREEIGKRHQGLPKGGWDGLMEKAAVAAIKVVETYGYELMDQYGISVTVPLPDDKKTL